MAKRITIIGDGAMGTVCALLLARKGADVVLWGYLAEAVDALRQRRINDRFLPGVVLPAGIEFTGRDEDCFRGAELVVSAVPCRYMRGVWGRLAGHLPAGLPIVSVAKGIENDSLLRPTQILAELAGRRPLAVLSGPNIAEELARALPATSTVASEDAEFARAVQSIIHTDWFRVYTNPDVIGVELAGAMKNVVAIAAGILDGLELGDNAKAALLTRGLVEITRLGVAMGARPETFAGLSGMGDLITTCISPRGRNRSFGQRIGQGRPVPEALTTIAGEVEGVNTCRSVAVLAERHGVEMPISRAVYEVLFEQKPAQKAVGELMTRRLKSENVL